MIDSMDKKKNPFDLSNSSYLNVSEDQGMISSEKVGNTLDFQANGLGPDDLHINLDFDAEWHPKNTDTMLSFGRKFREKTPTDKSKNPSKSERE